MLMSKNPQGEIEVYTDIGQFIGVLPKDYPIEKYAADEMEDGGPGSGNFNHRGRPGQQGGSLSKGASAQAEREQGWTNATRAFYGNNFESMKPGEKFESETVGPGFVAEYEKTPNGWKFTRKNKETGRVSEEREMSNVEFVNSLNRRLERSSRERKKEEKRRKEEEKNIEPESEALNPEESLGEMTDEEFEDWIDDLFDIEREDVFEEMPGYRWYGGDGGPGSGNFNHHGRPGLVGGSSAEGEAGENGGTVAVSPFAEETKEHREIASGWSDNQAAYFCKMNGLLTEEEAYGDSKKAREAVEKYFDAIEKNGDPTPTKPARKNSDAELDKYLDGPAHGNWDAARRMLICEWTGVDPEKAREMEKQLHAWSGGSWYSADTKVLDEYIEKDGVYDGEIYRGMSFSDEEYEEFMKDISVGSVLGMRGYNSSWTSSKEQALHFTYGKKRRVVITCTNNKTSAPIEPFNYYGELEVLAHSRAQWTVLGVIEGSSRTEITVMEKSEMMDDAEALSRRKRANVNGQDKMPEEYFSLEEKMNEQAKYMFVAPEKESANDGGPGSGNFGHAGRPGKVGGSQKESGGSAFRSGSKESGYSSFVKHEQFKGIVSHARASSDYHQFVKSLSKEQKEALRDQRSACGTSESMQTYATRMYNMLHNRVAKSEIRQQNKPVDGRDLSNEWVSKFGNKRQDNPTKAIDTDIEDILHMQGFDGVPKIVSGAEFDRITKEHPEMPILMRSFAGKDEAQLKEFDNDLEHGWFYVDCSKGGAGFGQGMYTAGVYDHEIADPKDWQTAKHIPTCVRDGAGRIYEVERRSFETNNPILRDPDPGDRYMFSKENEDGTFENRILEYVDLEDMGMCWMDTVTNEFLEDDMWMGPYDEFYDVSEVTEAGAREKFLEGAKNEMGHYRRGSIHRIRQESVPEAPEGKEVAKGTNEYGKTVYYSYDPNAMRVLDPNELKEGMKIALSYDGDPANVYYIGPDGLVSTLSGTDYFYLNSINLKDYKFAEVENQLKADVNPVASTRMMTLDPSAKIITYDKLEVEISKAKQNVYVKSLKENTDKYLADKGIEDETIREIFFHKVKSTGGSNRKAEEMLNNATTDQKRMMEEIENGINIDQIRGMKQDASGKAHDRFPDDEGACAALLGYDAINAEGHGQSKSYTIVLNRTKVILSEDRVEIKE